MRVWNLHVQRQYTFKCHVIREELISLSPMSTGRMMVIQLGILTFLWFTGQNQILLYILSCRIQCGSFIQTYRVLWE